MNKMIKKIKDFQITYTLLIFMFVICLLPAIAKGLSQSFTVTVSHLHCDDGCTGESDADRTCIDMESGSAECGWSDVVGSGAISWTASHNGTFCCVDRGDNALQITYNTTDATHILRNFTPNGTDALYYQFYFNVVSEGLADGEDDPIMCTMNSAENTNFCLSLKQTSGSLYLISKYLDGSNFWITTSDSTNTLSTGTWYRIRMTHDTGDSVVVYWAQCNGTAIETLLNDTYYAQDEQYIRFGSVNASDGAHIIQYDNIKVDDDTAISEGCYE